MRHVGVEGVGKPHLVAIESAGGGCHSSGTISSHPVTLVNLFRCRDSKGLPVCPASSGWSFSKETARHGNRKEGVGGCFLRVALSR
ncbi:hypothetical protein CDAR_514561 [Caerostris darwini]|uniref:Uncharacterized protein n=1 Tax=Caerostris darwini TaxID=1538125 RepID=A0AAV4NF20_9ARAC|nr:hypothetical protein CDAR_514561 [Caerostris darwini]